MEAKSVSRSRARMSSMRCRRYDACMNKAQVCGRQSFPVERPISEALPRWGSFSRQALHRTRSRKSPKSRKSYRKSGFGDQTPYSVRKITGRERQTVIEDCDDHDHDEWRHPDYRPNRAYFRSLAVNSYRPLLVCIPCKLLDEALRPNLVNGVPDVGTEAVGSKVFEDHPRRAQCVLKSLICFSSPIATVRFTMSMFGCLLNHHVFNCEF